MGRRHLLLLGKVGSETIDRLREIAEARLRLAQVLLPHGCESVQPLPTPNPTPPYQHRQPHARAVRALSRTRKSVLSLSLSLSLF